MKPTEILDAEFVDLPDGRSPAPPPRPKRARVTSEPAREKSIAKPKPGLDSLLTDLGVRALQNAANTHPVTAGLRVGEAFRPLLGKLAKDILR